MLAGFKNVDRATQGNQNRVPGSYGSKSPTARNTEARCGHADEKAETGIGIHQELRM